jgi:23S rRNA pseudouridine1911/1915/1917 synthase
MEQSLPEILYQSEHAVVINKRPGEAAEGARGDIRDLGPLLSERFGRPLFPVHRLDVPVSGCLLFARTPEARSFLSAAFAQGRVEKQYWGIVEKPAASLPEAGEPVHWIKTDTKRNKSIAYDREVPGSRKAVLRYRIIGEGEHYLFLEIDLLTGRHHQIRAQLARLGLHVKGDLKYGSRRSEKAGGIRLHSYTLSFPSPSGERVQVSADPPLRDALWDACRQAAGRYPTE